MGLFSDKCQALIDSTTGKALSGSALEKARQDKNWPRCLNRISKRAKFCNKCGTGAPGGWWKCPACGEWVGNESNFCWSCKQPLYPDQRTDIAGGVWQKPRDAFAERFEIGDIKKLLQTGIHIQTGTAAILLDSGAYKDVLGPGRHNLDSVGHKINWWGNPPPRSAILVDNGDTVLPLRVDSLRSSENIPLELFAEVTLHFNAKKGENFVANLFKDAKRITYQEVSSALHGDIRYAAENLCTTSTADDLVKDPQRRLHIEDALQKTLKDALERYGLEIVRLGAVDFTGREYEELRKKNGDAEIKRREMEVALRLRELTASDRMSQFKTDQDINEYAAQLAQERNVSAEKRNQDLSMLRLVHRHEIDGNEAAFAMATELNKTGHDIGIKMKWDDYTNNRLTNEARTKAEVAKIWMEVREKNLKIQRDHLDETAKIHGKMSIQTLIAMTDDRARREDLLKLQQQLAAEGKSADEILALQATQNPELVRVMLERERAKREDREKDLSKQEKMMGDVLERMERVLKSALETTSEAARHPGSSVQNVK
ncbi:MAG: hypothetical protein C0404_01575 [Verrucomicrobia bacterium]|nr:hypothetical protein [Verrucomicrobiota bacterium]